MPSSKILRVQRADSAHDYVLIRTSSNGKHALDLDLLGTEGSNPFIGKVRQRKLKDLQSKSYQDDHEEWEIILKHILGVENTPASTALVKDLQILAEVQGDDPNQRIVIILRKRIQQITQRLGSIELQQNDDAEVQLFDWTTQAVQDVEHQSAEVDRLTCSLESAMSSIKALQEKLEELAKLKSEQDNQLFSQFAALLNEKKVKIRNQQRLISSAKIDPTTLRELQHTAVEGGDKNYTPADSRKGKRKATTVPVESSDEDAFDTMDLDHGDSPGGTRDDFQAVTESDRDSTPEAETEEEEKSEYEKTEIDPRAKAKENVSSLPPPKRSLPFNRRADAKSHQDRQDGQEQQVETKSFVPPRNEIDDEDEDETATEDDDEL